MHYNTIQYNVSVQTSPKYESLNIGCPNPYGSNSRRDSYCCAGKTRLKSRVRYRYALSGAGENCVLMEGALLAPTTKNDHRNERLRNKITCRELDD